MRRNGTRDVSKHAVIGRRGRRFRPGAGLGWRTRLRECARVREQDQAGWIVADLSVRPAGDLVDFRLRLRRTAALAIETPELVAQAHAGEPYPAEIAGPGHEPRMPARF